MTEKEGRTKIHFSSKNSSHPLLAYFLDLGDIHFKKIWKELPSYCSTRRSTESFAKC